MDASNVPDMKPDNAMAAQTKTVARGPRLRSLIPFATLGRQVLRSMHCVNLLVLPTSTVNIPRRTECFASGS
jgi:hypothetical protein